MPTAAGAVRRWAETASAGEASVLLLLIALGLGRPAMPQPSPASREYLRPDCSIMSSSAATNDKKPCAQMMTTTPTSTRWRNNARSPMLEFVLVALLRIPAGFWPPLLGRKKIFKCRKYRSQYLWIVGPLIIDHDEATNTVAAKIRKRSATSA
jgi:hypothetical protein